MSTPSVKTFRAIRKLHITLADDVQITRAGSHYRARFFGCTNSVFGATADEARRRLLEAPRYIGHDNLRITEVRERIGRYKKK